MMEQVPAANGVTILSVTEQTVGVAEVNVTGRPEVAVAVALMVPRPREREVGLSENVMVCEPCRMVALLVRLTGAQVASPA